MSFEEFLNQFSPELAEETKFEMEKTRSQVASDLKYRAARCISRLIALEPLEDKNRIWELIEQEENWWEDWTAAFGRAVNKLNS